MLKNFKNILFLSLFLVTSCVTIKSINQGVYIQKNDNEILFETEQYTFKKNNEFDYTLFHDNLSSSKYVTGKYKIKNHKLKLYFTENVISQPKSFIKVSKKNKNVGTNYKLSFLIKDKIDVFPYANISILDINSRVINNTTTDINGYAELELSKEHQNLKISIQHVGYKTVEYLLEDTMNTNFNVILVPNLQGEKIENKILKKQIKFINQGFILNNKIFKKLK